MIRIVKWDETFENSNTRKRTLPIQWYSAPAGRDSKGFRALARMGNRGMMAYGVFHALCGVVASLRRETRQTGEIRDSHGRPMTMDDLEDLTRLPAHVIDEAVEILRDIGWVEDITENDDPCPSPPEEPPLAHDSPSPRPALAQPSPNGHPPEGKGEDRTGEGGEGIRRPPSPEIPDEVSSPDEQIVWRNLASCFPDAPSAVSREERTILPEILPHLRDLAEHDWHAIRAWNEAPDRVRGRKLWPRDRGEFLAHYFEAIQKIRPWWRATGRRWWQRRQAAPSPCPAPPPETPDTLTTEEALAILRE